VRDDVELDPPSLKRIAILWLSSPPTTAPPRARAIILGRSWRSVSRPEVPSLSPPCAYLPPYSVSGRSVIYAEVADYRFREKVRASRDAIRGIARRCIEQCRGHGENHTRLDALTIVILIIFFYEKSIMRADARRLTDALVLFKPRICPRAKALVYTRLYTNLSALNSHRSSSPLFTAVFAWNVLYVIYVNEITRCGD